MNEVKKNKYLGQYETIRIGFEGRNEYLEISGNGNVKFDYGTHGGEENMFNGKATSGWTNGSNQHQNADKIAQYLYMLLEAQKVDHSVHTEIAEALKLYRQELGI